MRKNIFREFCKLTYAANIKNPRPGKQEILSAANWQDYFRNKTVNFIVEEDDAESMFLGTDGFLYRVDAAETFCMSYTTMLSAVQLRNQQEHPMWQTFVKPQLNNPYGRMWHLVESGQWLDILQEEVSDGYLPYLLEPLHRLLELSQDYVESFLQVLCCFYPDFIGEYYRQYIRNAQNIAALALENASAS